MCKRIFVFVILAAFLNMTLGCSHAVKVKKEKIRGPKEEIVKVALLDGRVIEFYKNGGRYSKDAGNISGITVKIDTVVYKGRQVLDKEYASITVPEDSVLQVWVKRGDPVQTFFLVVSIVAGVGLLAVGLVAALKESCPFVYSFDGQNFTFDAEPLGGAICQGLQRSDCSRLDHMAAADGRYRLRFQNEVPEMQYLDQVQMLIVDHAPSELIVPDSACRLHAISQPMSPEQAVDENGADLMPFVKSDDGLVWQTPMWETAIMQNEETRHHLTFEFPKPADARYARLIINAGTAIWGSNMIREMLQMRGSGVDSWYRSVNREESAAEELLAFNLREEMYIMKLHVLKDSTFVERALIMGGGPFIAEDRVLTVDIGDIVGDRLTLRMNPPKGFWTIDYLAVEYDNDALVSPVVLPIVSARDQDGRDIGYMLTAVDSTYYIMKEVGDWADIDFDAMPRGDDRMRSIFLKTTGYYEIQIDKSIPEKTDLISRLLHEPGTIISYSLQAFLKWQQYQRRNN